MVQLARIVNSEGRTAGAARFIIYFAKEVWFKKVKKLWVISARVLKIPSPRTVPDYPTGVTMSKHSVRRR